MIDIKEIKKAEKIIKDHIIRTPLVYSPTFSRISNAQIYLKLENLQKTGSFKARGATYKLLVRKNDIGKAGVVAASAGNHGQGVALAARNSKTHATILFEIAFKEKFKNALQDVYISKGHGSHVTFFLKAYLSHSLGFDLQIHTISDVCTG